MANGRLEVDGSLLVASRVVISPKIEIVFMFVLLVSKVLQVQAEEQLLDKTPYAVGDL